MKPAKVMRPVVKLARAEKVQPEDDPLARYWAKRDFTITAEPRGEHLRDRQGALTFVIQKHAASRLHYDFGSSLTAYWCLGLCPRGRALIR